MNKLIEFENFHKIFLADTEVVVHSQIILENKPLQNVIDQIGGKSYNRGLFCIYSAEDVIEFTKLVEKPFPNSKEKVYCFGRDWLNRQLAITVDEQSSVVLFDLCFDKVLDTGYSLVDFFEEGIILKREALFAEEFFLDWEKSSNEKLNYERCVNYIVLPFLGGKDDIGNLEVSSCKFAYELNTALILKTQEMNEGEKVGKVSIDTGKKKPWWKFK